VCSIPIPKLGRTLDSRTGWQGKRSFWESNRGDLHNGEVVAKIFNVQQKNEMH
jgi:hypothetical protein